MGPYPRGSILNPPVRVSRPGVAGSADTRAVHPDGLDPRRWTVLEMWSYRTDIVTEPAADLIGFGVEARDGSIGKVDDSTADAGKSHVVVDTGPWIFGRKVLLPARTVERIDLDARTIFVDRTKEEIKNAPEFDPERGIDPTYQDELGGYYGQFYR
jgi:hypothetical protein